MNKGQVYTYDFLIALTIIVIALLISFKLIFNSVPEEDYSVLELEGKVISSLFLSNGNPTNWTETNVIIPGILSDGRINTTKLDQLNILGYDNATALLNTRSNYFFYFENKSGVMNLSDCGFGSSIITKNCLTPEFDAKNVARIDRIALLNNTAIKMVMLTWN